MGHGDSGGSPGKLVAAVVRLAGDPEVLLGNGGVGDAGVREGHLDGPVFDTRLIHHPSRRTAVNIKPLTGQPLPDVLALQQQTSCARDRPKPERRADLHHGVDGQVQEFADAQAGASVELDSKTVEGALDGAGGDQQLGRRRGQSGRADDQSLGRALAELGSAQNRLQTLDDDYYVRGIVALRRYARSGRSWSGRERLHATVDGASKQRLVLHPDPRALWAEADFGQRRELLRLIVEHVRVLPARRGARFDPSRVRIKVPLLSVVPLDRTG